MNFNYNVANSFVKRRHSCHFKQNCKKIPLYINLNCLSFTHNLSKFCDSPRIVPTLRFNLLWPTLEDDLWTFAAASDRFQLRVGSSQLGDSKPEILELRFPSAANEWNLELT